MQSALHFIARALRSIVLALTNLVRSVAICGLIATLFACTPEVYVERATSISFQQLVEADSIIGARSKAHAMQGRVRGAAPSQSGGYLEPMHLPEAYTLDGSEGLRASQYHLGYVAARLIRAYYADAYPNGLQIESDKLIDVVDVAGGNTDTIYEPNCDWPY